MFFFSDSRVEMKRRGEKRESQTLKNWEVFFLYCRIKVFVPFAIGGCQRQMNALCSASKQLHIKTSFMSVEGI